MLAATSKIEALIGFGSLANLDRFDDMSDLDFIVVPKKEFRKEVIENAAWIESIYPVVLKRRFTLDGYKVIFRDGVLCDFGILTVEEIRAIPHDTGRVIWSVSNFDQSVCEVNYACQYHVESCKEKEKLLELAVVDIYVGLLRLKRGEKLSATKVIQEEALEKVLNALYGSHKNNSAVANDIFQIHRRIEFIHKDAEEFLNSALLGYEKSLQSAIYQLKVIEENIELDIHLRGLLNETIKAIN